MSSKKYNTSRDVSRDPKQKSKLGDSSQVSYKKSATTLNDRLVVNKLGMKFDPVCWKKNHEKGRIQFVCIEDQCNADRRLACAHCIIDEHEEHVSNKITVEQYCDTFDNNYKWFLFNLAKLDIENKQSKLMDIQEQINKDIDTIIETITCKLNQVKDEYIEQILDYTQQQNIKLLKYQQQQIINGGKMKEYFNKNLFEMTPAELDHSMLLIGTKHLQQFDNILMQFETSNTNLNSYISQQWNVINDQIQSNIESSLGSLIDAPFNFNTPNSHLNTPQQQQSPANQLIPLTTHRDQDRLDTQQLKELKRVSSIAMPSGLNSPLRKITPHNPQAAYFVNIPNSTQQSSSKTQHERRGLSLISMTAGENNHNSHITKPGERRLSQPYAQHPTSTLQCSHGEPPHTLPIFSCCNTVYPCYECHDLYCNHKAHITVPSQRLCKNCSEVFQANCLSTVDVKCAKSKFDPYVVLGLQKSANEEEIRAAYHKMSKLYHPDVNNTKETEEKFRLINEAYLQLKQQKFDDKVKSDFKSYQEYQTYVDMTEDQIFKVVFGFTYAENPAAYYAAENAYKRQQYEDILLKTQRKAPSYSADQGNTADIKVNRVYKEQQQKANENHSSTLRMMLFGGLALGFMGIYFIYKRPSDVQNKNLANEKISKIRETTMARYDRDIENVKQMYKGINETMLKFNPEVGALEILLKYTIYPDIKLYCVDPQHFYAPAEQYLKKSEFEKFPIEKTKIQYRVSHACEAQRCLQNIFVPVDHVLSELEKNGKYKPPGIFFQFHGYIHFKIRNKPINVENLKAANGKYISLFDLFFKYQSPVPYYYDEWQEFQFFELEQTAGKEMMIWQGNAQFDSKPMAKVYLKGNVQNVFMHRPNPNSNEERRNVFAWQDHFHKFLPQA